MFLFGKSRKKEETKTPGVPTSSLRQTQVPIRGGGEEYPRRVALKETGWASARPKP